MVNEPLEQRNHPDFILTGLMTVEAVRYSLLKGLVQESNQSSFFGILIL